MGDKERIKTGGCGGVMDRREGIVGPSTRGHVQALREETCEVKST